MCTFTYTFIWWSGKTLYNQRWPSSSEHKGLWETDKQPQWNFHWDLISAVFVNQALCRNMFLFSSCPTFLLSSLCIWAGSMNMCSWGIVQSWDLIVGTINTLNLCAVLINSKRRILRHTCCQIWSAQNSLIGSWTLFPVVKKVQYGLLLHVVLGKSKSQDKLLYN